MEGVFLKLLNMSISAGWVILAVMLIRVLFRKGPKWARCILWGIVGLRLICPISFESVLSLIPSAETIPEEILLAKKPEIDSGVKVVNQIVNPILSGSLSPNPGDSVNPMQVLSIVGAYIWVAGVFVLLLHALISYVRLKQKVVAAMPVEGNIYICDYVESPFILGVLRPRIYLPSALAWERVPYVISHERAHLKRGDQLWKPLGYLLLVVYWFHPLVWAAYVRLCRDIELACDERVIRELGEYEKKTYSDALLECSIPRRQIALCPLAFGEVGVKERVKTVLHYKKPGFWLLLGAVLTCVVMGVCFLTNPKESLLHAPEPLCHTYRIEETTYTCGKELISSIMHPIDFARYCYTADYLVYVKDCVSGEVGEDWQNVGAAKEVKLTKDNFDAYFKEWQGMKGWPYDFSPEKYRKENASAYQVLRGYGELSYYLLQQKNGDVYLVLWYCDSEDAEDSYVRWMFKVDRTDYVTAYLKYPGVTSFFEFSWCPEHKEDYLYEEVQTIDAPEGGTLEFMVDGSPKELFVEEEFYDAENKLLKTGNYTLVKNWEDVYSLEIQKPAEQEAAYAMYYATYRGGKYVCKLDFSVYTQSDEAFAESDGPETEAMETDSLEVAIHDAVLDRMGEKAVEGVFLPCESHVILGTEELCAVPKADGSGGGEFLTVYAMVLTQRFAFTGPEGAIVEDGGSHIPTALTFKVEGNQYFLKEYWVPRDGSYYAQDIRDKFPEDIEEDALNTQKYIYGQMQDCYQQAITFAGTDTEAVIAGLMEEILSSPKSASDVQDYISAHYLEYRELIYYGTSTLIYCRERFEAGNQTGPGGALLAAVSQDIAKSYGWESVYANQGSNGQEWYDEYGRDAIFVPLGLAEEASGNDWGIFLTVDNVTGDGLELTIHQSGGSYTGTLEYGSDFKVMMWQDGVWKPVPYIKDNIAWTAEAYIVSLDNSISGEIRWKWCYGTLPAGKYRLVKEFMDFRRSGDFDKEKIYVDFEIVK